jgi:hypothetical protein
MHYAERRADRLLARSLTHSLTHSLTDWLTDWLQGLIEHPCILCCIELNWASIRPLLLLLDRCVTLQEVSYLCLGSLTLNVSWAVSWIIQMVEDACAGQATQFPPCLAPVSAIISCTWKRTYVTWEASCGPYLVRSLPSAGHVHFSLSKDWMCMWIFTGNM